MRSSTCWLQALLPLTALGWRGPDAPMDEALAGYYPLTLMETGLGVGGNRVAINPCEDIETHYHCTGTDILFFWVARMVFLCSELTSSASSSAAVAPGCAGAPPPFEHVWLHPVCAVTDGVMAACS